MKSRILPVLLTVGMIWLLGGTSPAEVNPDLPIEYIPFPRANKVEPLIQVRVDHVGLGNFAYSYTVTSGLGSQQPFVSFSLGTSVEPTSYSAPAGWGGHSDFDTGYAPDTVWFCVESEEDMLAPGGSITIGFTCVGPPAVGISYSEGDIVPPSGQQVVLPPAEDDPQTWEANTAQRPSVVPTTLPDPLVAPDFAAFLEDQYRKALALGWVTNGGSTQDTLLRLQSELLSQDTAAAIRTIQLLLSSLEELRGQGMTDEAYYVLKPNLEFLLQTINPRSESTLPVTKDSTLRLRDPSQRRSEP